MSDQHQQLRPTAAHVGRTFVKQYYTILSEDPNNLHRFYKDESVMSHGVEGQDEIEEVYGQTNIHQKILSMDYKKSNARLTLVDCQPSLNGGFIVSVVGHLYNESQKPTVARRFLQVFFLAVQPIASGVSSIGYFVLNDVFRYLKEPTGSPVVSTATPVANTNAASPVAVPDVAQQQSTTPPATKSHIHDKQNHNHTNEKRNELAPVTQPNNVNTASVQPPQQPLPSPQPQLQSPQPQPQSLQSQHTAKKQTIATPAPEPLKLEELTPKTWAHLVGGPAYMEHIRTKESTKVQQPNNDDETILDLKLYVSNIPYESTKQTLESEFKKYGIIKYINWKSNNGYAFVEYESEEGVNAVIKHIENEPIVLEGRTLRIERKKIVRGKQNGRGGGNRGQTWKKNERRNQSFGSQPFQSQQPHNNDNNQQADNTKDNKDNQNKQRPKVNGQKQNNKNGPANKRTVSAVN